GAYASWTFLGPGRFEGEVPTEPLSSDALAGYLAHRDVSDHGYTDLFSAYDAVAASAEHAEGESPVEKAHALAGYVSERREAGAIERFSFALPRKETFFEPAEAAAAIAGDEGVHLYPLEVSALSVSALRSVGVPA